MPTTIKLKNSVTTTSTPTSLVQGEVAINITDKKVWVGNAATTPIQLLGTGADGTFTNISVSSVATFGAGTSSAPSITTTGDTNTGIFFPAADTIAFTEGGVESIRINSSGNVLVGTNTNPSESQARQVLATSSSAYLQFARTATTVGGALIGTGGQNFIVQTYTGAIGSETYTERMRIDSSGNVGIGCTPSAVGSYRVLELNNTTGGLYYCQANGTRVSQWYGTATEGGIGQMANTPFLFYTNNSERMRIDSSGNVGIGTSTFASGSRLAVQTTAGKFDVVANGGGSIGLVSSGAFLFNSNSTFLWSTGASDWMALDNSGRLSIGATSAPSLYPAPLNVTTTSANAAAITIRGRSSDNIGNVYFNSNSGATNYAYISASSTDLAQFNTTATGAFIFGTNSTERMRISSSGTFSIAKTNDDSTVNGAYFNPSAGGFFHFVVTNTTATAAQSTMYLNRQSSDGRLIEFRQADTAEGDISVSGTTVSYNGGHLSRWSQLPDGSKDDTILKGTVLTNLDDMCVWTKDGEQLPNEQLNKMKVSDVEGDTNVAGVFVNWIFDEQCQSEDMNVAMTGDMIIRIAEGVVVQKGDLLMSAGDGTAKPQGDDIVRSKTIAKVTSNHVTCTYADGSYCVPCVLMAC